MALTPTNRARGAIDVNLITGYDETNDWQKISIANDAVGITKEATQQLIYAQLDLKISELRDALKGANNKDFSTLEIDVEGILSQMDVALSTRASESTLNSIKLQTDNLTFDANNFLKVATQADKVTQQPLSAVSIAAASTQNADIVVPTGRSGIAVTLKATYDVSATAGVRLDALYSPDGTNYDTDTDDTYAHPFTAGTTKQKTYIIPAIHPYVRLAVVNLDASYAVTTDLWVTFV